MEEEERGVELEEGASGMPPEEVPPREVSVAKR